MSKPVSWNRFQQCLCRIPALEFTLDVSRMDLADGFLEKMKPAMSRAFTAMSELERGTIANPDEKRMVGHYWLRTPELAPSAEITNEIRRAVSDIKSFASAIHEGKVRPTKAPKFTHVLSIGIGGSALGPMFVADALGNPATDR